MPIAGAAADELPERWKRAELAVGAYLATFGSDLRVDSDDLGAGTDIDLEDTLDLDDELASFWVNGYWRFFDRHRLEFTYYDLSRDGRRSLDEDVQFGDQTFEVGASVDSEIEFRVGKLAYAYSIVQTEQWDAALALGLTAIQLKATLSGEIEAGDASAGREVDTAETVAPLPVLGGRVWYAFADNWTARLEGDLFALEFGDYEGSLVDAEISLDYDLTDWFGVSLGYNYVDINVDKTGGSFDASIGYDYSAITLAGRIFLN
jgi:hypothetical protein